MLCSYLSLPLSLLHKHILYSDHNLVSGLLSFSLFFLSFVENEDSDLQATKEKFTKKGETQSESKKKSNLHRSASLKLVFNLPLDTLLLTLKLHYHFVRVEEQGYVHTNTGISFWCLSTFGPFVPM